MTLLTLHGIHISGKSRDPGEGDSSRRVEGLTGGGLEHGQHDHLLVGTKVSQDLFRVHWVGFAVTATLLVFVGITELYIESG